MTTTVPHLFTAGELLEHFVATGEPTAAEVDVALGRVGRNAGPALLLDLRYEGLLTAEAAAANVGPAWSAAEYPLRQLSRDDWRDLFTLAEYTVDGEPAARPRKPVRLYRGAVAEHRGGWSWTDDPAVARRFASGELLGRRTGSVWTVLAPPEALLGQLVEDRGEHEYVVDTYRLKVEPHAEEVR